MLFYWRTILQICPDLQLSDEKTVPRTGEGTRGNLLNSFSPVLTGTDISFSWTISKDKICQKHGVLSRQTDYIELYRVVDYRETQTFLQRLLGVKTVTIISTDKSDPEMLIKGVPAKTDLVDYTRKLVEQNKKQNHIYEITNR